MTAAIGIPALDRRQPPLVDQALQLGQAEAAQLDRGTGFRHAPPTVIAGGAKQSGLASFGLLRHSSRAMTATRTAIVTGAGKRVGADIARALIEDGWSVIAHVHHEADQVPDGAIKVVADLGQADCAEIIFEAAAGLPVRLLINNAARFAHDVFGAFEADEFTAHMAVNARAPALLIDRFARQHDA